MTARQTLLNGKCAPRGQRHGTGTAGSQNSADYPAGL